MYLRAGVGGTKESEPTQVYVDGSPLVVAEAGRGVWTTEHRTWKKRPGAGPYEYGGYYDITYSYHPGQDASLSSDRSELAPRREGRERDGRIVISYKTCQA